VQCHTTGLDSAFEVNSQKRLFVASDLNFEASTTANVTIVCVDARNTSLVSQPVTFQIAILDIDEPPVFVLLPSADLVSVYTDAPTGTNVTAVRAVDEDRSDVVTYAIADDVDHNGKSGNASHEGILAIGLHSGVVTVGSSEALAGALMPSTALFRDLSVTITAMTRTLNATTRFVLRIEAALDERGGAGETTTSSGGGSGGGNMLIIIVIAVLAVVAAVTLTMCCLFAYRSRMQHAKRSKLKLAIESTAAAEGVCMYQNPLSIRNAAQVAPTATLRNGKHMHDEHIWQDTWDPEIYETQAHNIPGATVPWSLSACPTVQDSQEHQQQPTYETVVDYRAVTQFVRPDDNSRHNTPRSHGPENVYECGYVIQLEQPEAIYEATTDE
jgi:hypothetical protein